MEECKKCAALCCQMGNIQVFHDEFDRLSQHQVPILHRDTDLIKLIYGPCPFLSDNRCTIYLDRSQACRRYPLYIKLTNQTATLDLNNKCPAYVNHDTQISHQRSLKESFSKGELISMIEAAFESDARLILAEYFLSPYDSVPKIHFTESSQKREWIQDFAENSICSIQRYHELITIFIIELLKTPSYRNRLEKEYPERLEKYDAILQIKTSSN